MIYSLNPETPMRKEADPKKTNNNNSQNNNKEENNEKINKKNLGDNLYGEKRLVC